MARGSKVEFNRRNAERLELAIADGVFAVARHVVEQARPPDATPFGEGLVTRGGAIGWVRGKKIAQFSLSSANTVKKPRAVRVPRDGAFAIGGFGFPARFQEIGTVHHGAQPFLLPSINETKAEAVQIAGAVIRSEMGRE